MVATFIREIVYVKQILQNISSGKIVIEDVPIPSSSAGNILIASTASLISAGTERMLLECLDRTGSHTNTELELARIYAKSRRREQLGRVLQPLIDKLNENASALALRQVEQLAYAHALFGNREASGRHLKRAQELGATDYTAACIQALHRAR